MSTQFHFTDVRSHILTHLNNAKSSLLIAVSWLTDREIYNILLQKLEENVAVSIITRNDRLSNHEEALDWNLLMECGAELRFCQPGAMLHYKFCIIDQATVLLTSHNWTCFQAENNRENLAVFTDAHALESYTNEWTALCGMFELQSGHIPRLTIDKVPEPLHGFYALTISDDLRLQKV